MTPNATISGEVPASSSTEDTPSIMLHILSPSPDAPNRLTFTDLSLATTIADLKQRITESLTSHPPADQQRLIYRGRPIRSDNMILQTVLEPSDAPEYTLHLVLPPKSTHSLPSGRATRSSTPILEPRENAGPTHPAPPASFPLPNHDLPGYQGLRFRPQAARPPASSPLLQNEADLASVARQSIDALHRQLESQEQARRQPQQQQAQPSQSHQQPLPHQPPQPSQGPPPAITTARVHPFSNPPTFQSFSMRTITSHPTVPTVPAQPSGGTISASLRVVPNQTAPFNVPLYRVPPGVHPVAIPTAEEGDVRRLRFLALQQQIILMEAQLSRGIIPSVEDIAAVRTQLYILMDDQYRNPLAPRDGYAETLLARIWNVTIRGDQLRILQSRLPTTPPNNAVYLTANRDSPSPVYLLSSPAGDQAFILSSVDAGTAVQPAAGNVPPQPTSNLGLAPPPQRGAAQGVVPEPAAPMMENVVRQALLHNGGRPRQDGLVRHAWRLWLFIRLYFFCYLLSESGSWSRIFLVLAALLISALSETDFLRRLQRSILEPVQRHLEGLLHGGEEGPRPPLNRHVDSMANRPANSPGPHADAGAMAPAPHAVGDQFGPIVPAGMQQSLRRFERSVALFLASLVPGVGERHIGVRNAAEAARHAERLREEERRQQHESDNTEQANASRGTSGSDLNRTDRETATSERNEVRDRE